RRGAPRPVVVLSEQGGSRRAAITAGGLYRWAFRGGANAEAYRALVAALTDWLLASAAATSDEVVPAAREVPNGMPVAWRWTGVGAPRPVALELVGPGGARVDTLRFDVDGRAELRLPAGVYRYAPGALGRAPRGVRAAGLVAVDTYSDEWPPSPPVLAPQAGAPAARHVSVGLRERWWLFVVAVAAFAAEWAGRRVLGLP
ncbi:MAG TPA: hypothetical protein VH158_07500, partial [Gemmatimonadales bacterium]|nr:hypothetical protein [Gemmatimonadales bacterium]